LTYSIVARDPANGDLGVAVQSHYFGTGRLVTWAEAGVGAVATQSVVEVSYGPKGLDLMRGGVAANDSLGRLVAADPEAFIRQVAMVDANGIVGTHTGAGCIGRAGHCRGHQVSAQANMMERETVWGAMIDAYQGAVGADLAERLLLALEAAESEGGDVRGKQSAAILVVSGQRSDAPWDQRTVDLRVDDAESPLEEMRRLLAVNRAVDRLTGVFDGGLIFAPSVDGNDPQLATALEDLQAAQDGMGSNREPTFWAAVLLAKAGRIEEARTRLAFAAETNPRWVLFLETLAGAGVLPADNALLNT
jgi:uncharacterized Ntn-hydrolase superfamily protein